ncbi:MAG: histone deacetylase [Alcanivoracaceae bacterium]|nr:histone deacetylase [Alcanivoracaceae bacterium]
MLPLVTHPEYSYPFPGEHRFPMEKFGLLLSHLQDKGIATPANTFRPGRARPALLRQAHCPEYVSAFINGTLSARALRRIGLPFSEGLVRRTLLAPTGTLLTAQLALKHGIACHLAGGTHHAHYDYGAGFCVINDLAVTARALLASNRVRRLLIFDCDVHQGDGTAAILADEPRAYTCSIHCEKNFPVRKHNSDLDIGLERGLADDAYLGTVRRTLGQCLEAVQPDLVLYDAGVDVYAGDPLGLLAVSEGAIAERERLVIRQCRQAGVPVATVIGGGYDDDRQALARRHALVIEQAWRLLQQA